MRFHRGLVRDVLELWCLSILLYYITLYQSLLYLKPFMSLQLNTHAFQLFIIQVRGSLARGSVFQALF